MSLNEIFNKYKISLIDREGELRNVIDVLEDIYLKMTPVEVATLTFEIGEEELHKNLFDEARKTLVKRSIK